MARRSRKPRREKEPDPLIGRRGEERSTLIMLRKAIREGWAIPPAMMEKAPRIAAQIAESGATEREQLRAIEVLAAMRRDNLAAVESLDKIERLESGDATEIIEFAPLSLKAST